MGERIVVSGGGGLRELPVPPGKACRPIALHGAGALCASRECLYAASCLDGAIWKLDARLLVPTGLFSGGPGICRMMLSRTGARLYALCGDADSLLMLDARSGAPLLLNRVGVAPCAMTMDETGRLIAVAGGASGEIVLLEADTLRVLRRMQAGGVAFGAALCGGVAYALCLDETMNSTLTAFGHAGACGMLSLPGMPGTVEVIGGQIVAATHERICVVAPDASRVLVSCDAAGRAGRIWHSGAGLMMTDVWTESLFWRERAAGRWHLCAEQVTDAVWLAQ